MSMINNSGIITYNKEQDNLLVGGLKVNKRKELEELKDGLLQNRNMYKVSVENLGGLSSMVHSGFSREGEQLIYQKVTDFNFEDDVSLYTKKIIEFTALNSLLLMISMSGELDSTHYDGLAKQFIRMGIINCKRFENIWDVCSRNIVNGVFSEISKSDICDLDKLLTNDLVTFRFLLEEGIISYDVIKEIPFGKVVDEAVFKAWDKKTREELAINNALIMNDNAIFEEYVKKRRK